MKIKTCFFSFLFITFFSGCLCSGTEQELKDSDWFCGITGHSIKVFTFNDTGSKVENEKICFDFCKSREYKSSTCDVNPTVFVGGFFDEFFGEGSNFSEYEDCRARGEFGYNCKDYSFICQGGECICRTK